VELANPFQRLSLQSLEAIVFKFNRRVFTGDEVDFCGICARGRQIENRFEGGIAHRSDLRSTLKKEGTPQTVTQISPRYGKKLRVVD
jgi:hypothetical protein